MKKNINISLILIMLVTICMFVTNVYATSSATMQLNTDYNAGDHVVVEAQLSNLITDRGVIALGAVLEYDKDVLEFKEIAGKNGWVASNSSYNPESGKIITDKNEPVTTDEVVFTITFKVKNMSANSASITLKEIEMGDGGSNGVANLKSVTKTITIKEIDTPNTNPNPGTTTEPSESGNKNQVTNSNSGTTTKPSESGNKNQVTNSNSGTTTKLSESENKNQVTDSNSGTTTEPSESGNKNQVTNSNSGTTTKPSENGNKNQVTNRDENNVLNKNTNQANGQNKIENKVTTNDIQANGKLPKTGQNNIVIIVVLAIIVVRVIGRVCYIKLYKKKHQ